ncbi:winged helix-turn-helix transcriptional regulator [Halalkalibacter lacteus]|uniref:winged helix-turn-helix transcriptional regulator n=1 Tax=Halalkalibacter lacteus TaxID=3090663 RepID=UPI002FCB1FA2
MSECKVNTALEALVGKWKHKILFPLVNDNVMRFNELKRAIPGITQKMLTSQLRELEEHDLVTRKVYAQIPPKVEYSLSEHGKSLIPILEMMSKWGEAHVAHLETRNEEEKESQSK